MNTLRIHQITCDETLEAQLTDNIDVTDRIDLLNQLAFEYQYEDLEKAMAVAQEAEAIVE